jgi:hypothetical protein
VPRSADVMSRIIAVKARSRLMSHMPRGKSMVRVAPLRGRGIRSR